MTSSLRLRPRAAILASSLIALALAGCADLNVPGLTISAPVIPQSEHLSVPPFDVAVTRAYFTKDLEGAPAPEGKYLVVELKVVNMGSEGLGWNTARPPLFRLIGADGAKYSPGGQAVNRDDLSALCILGRNINPHLSLSGREVFDVPEGTYSLAIYFGQWAGGFNYTPGQLLGTWTLAPDSGVQP